MGENPPALFKAPPTPYPGPPPQWLQQMQAQHAADQTRRDLHAQQVAEALRAQQAADEALIPHQDLRVQSTAMFNAMQRRLQQDYALARAREKANRMDYVFEEPMWDLRGCKPRSVSCPPAFNHSAWRFVDV